MFCTIYLFGYIVTFYMYTEKDKRLILLSFLKFKYLFLSYSISLIIITFYLFFYFLLYIYILVHNAFEIYFIISSPTVIYIIVAIVINGAKGTVDTSFFFLSINSIIPTIAPTTYEP